MSGQFDAARDPSLRRAGLAGRPTVRLEGDALIVSGASDGRVTIRPSEVKRILIACSRARVGPLYETRIWRNGDEKPLVLVPRRSLEDKIEAYPDVIRGFARRLAESCGIDRIGIGRGRDAMRMPLFILHAFFLLLALLSLLVAVVGYWPFYGVVALCLLTLWWGRRTFKNAKLDVPIASLEELEPELDYTTKSRQGWERWAQGGRRSAGDRT